MAGATCCAFNCSDRRSTTNPVIWVPTEPVERRRVLSSLGRIDDHIQEYIDKKTRLCFCCSHLLDPDEYDRTKVILFDRNDPIFARSDRERQAMIDMKRARAHTSQKLESARKKNKADLEEESVASLRELVTDLNAQ